MLKLRKALKSDLEFLVRVDSVDEGVTQNEQLLKSKIDVEKHRIKMSKFIFEEDHGAFIYEDTSAKKQIGIIMYRISNRDHLPPWKTAYSKLPREWFQEDGRFLEVYQLWVDPDYRRMGIATQLKKKLEDAAKKESVNLLYTHTEEKNSHVVTLNKKLGYEEVRRGPIWDDVIRISLIKHLKCN